MTPKEFFEQPISTIVPSGYLGCLSCGIYFHHPITYCPSCGKIVIRHKDTTIKNFVLATKHHGSGVYNTINRYLNILTYYDSKSKLNYYDWANVDDNFWKFSDKYKPILNYLHRYL